ncbi:calcium-dependent protein kinase-like protein, partial [Tanacetum coccineum]
MSPISSLPSFMVCGVGGLLMTLVFAGLGWNLISPDVYGIIQLQPLVESVLKPVSWQGNHVAAAMAGFRYRFHTRRPEPLYKRVLPLITDVKVLVFCDGRLIWDSIVAFYIVADVDGNGTIDYVEFITPTMRRRKLEEDTRLELGYGSSGCSNIPEV